MIDKTAHYGLAIFGQNEWFSLSEINNNTTKIDELLKAEQTERINGDNLIKSKITAISNERIDSILGELYGSIT